MKKKDQKVEGVIGDDDAKAFGEKANAVAEYGRSSTENEFEGTTQDRRKAKRWWKEPWS